MKVTDEHGVTKTANEWVPETGRPRLLRKARVTKSRREVGAVVCVKAKGMKEPWCLASSHDEKTAAEIVKLYGACVARSAADALLKTAYLDCDVFMENDPIHDYHGHPEEHGHHTCRGGSEIRDQARMEARLGTR